MLSTSQEIIQEKKDMLEVDKITSQMDNNETPINIFLDLSKAFDTIDYNILLDK